MKFITIFSYPLGSEILHPVLEHSQHLFLSGNINSTLLILNVVCYVRKPRVACTFRIRK